MGLGEESTRFDMLVSPQERERALRGLRQGAYTVAGWGYLPGRPLTVPLAWVDRRADFRELAKRHDAAGVREGLDVAVYWKGGITPGGMSPGALRLDVTWGPPLSTTLALYFALPDLIALVRSAWEARALVVCEARPVDLQDLLSKRLRGIGVTFDNTCYNSLEEAFVAYGDHTEP